MKARKRLWLGLGIVALAAASFAVWSGTRDDLAALRKLHPAEWSHLSAGQRETFFAFKTDPRTIASLLPNLGVEGYDMSYDLRDGDRIGAKCYHFQLPSSREATFYIYDVPSRKGETCDLEVVTQNRWYLTAWEMISHRLGF